MNEQIKSEILIKLLIMKNVKKSVNCANIQTKLKSKKNKAKLNENGSKN